jgi:uncharacterized surface protein with fasciclin (FAS1) repeats
MKRQFLTWLTALGAAGLMTACGGGGGGSSDATTTTAGTNNTQQSASIAQKASESPDLSTLVAAVKYVDEGSSEKLLPLLSSPTGSLTVFAPNNAAFDKLAQELLGPGKKAADLLTPALKDTVRDILKYHVLTSKVLKGDIKPGQPISTALGSATFKIEVKNGQIVITDGQGRTSTINVTDLLASNGVIHLIDTVILPPKPPVADNSIVAIAAKTPALSSLVAAVGFASNDGDLVKLLSGTGTFTVFAPTNDAFDALAAELLGPGKKAADLLVPANKALVRAVLQYHVLGKVVKKADIPLGKPIDPVLEGKDIFKIDVESGKVLITDGRNRKSEIIATDIMASNGVVHLINKVILPADKDIVDTAIAATKATKPEFTVLVEAVVAAGLVDTLKGPGPFTVFAPTDEAFAALLAELHTSKDDLLKNKQLLTRVLTYHVVQGLVLKADVPVNTAINTVEGGAIKVGADFKITDLDNRKSQIIATDVLTKNGVIHVIDKVLLPGIH